MHREQLFYIYLHLPNNQTLSIMKSIFVFALLTFCSFQVFSQVDTTQLYEIATSDGNCFIGSIVSENESDIILKTFNYGEVPIKKYLITERKPIRSKKTARDTKQVKSVRIEPNEQTKDSLWRVVTSDGFDFVGTINNYETDAINLKTEKFGDIRILKESISSINLVDASQIVKGDVWFENPQASRYFYTPNGYGLKNGEGYSQNVWVLFNQVSYGFSDKFTMGVGTIPVFLLGADLFPFWITPKFSFPVVEDKINIGAGVFAGAILGDETVFALPYGTVTIGDRNKNLNIGGGYLAANGDGVGMFTASTMIRINKKSYFLSENFLLVNDSDAMLLISAGLRTVWPRVSLDYGLFLPIDEGINRLIAIPWVGFVVPFNRK